MRKRLSREEELEKKIDICKRLNNGDSDTIAAVLEWLEIVDNRYNERLRKGDKDRFEIYREFLSFIEFLTDIIRHPEQKLELFEQNRERSDKRHVLDNFTEMFSTKEDEDNKDVLRELQYEVSNTVPRKEE